MTFSTYSGKMSPEEVSQLMKVITLYSTGKLMKAKSGLPKTHQAESLKAKNDNWKEFLE